MERVEGIGGFLFRAKDPKKLAGWYEANLGVTSVPDKQGALPWRTSAGTAAFATFKERIQVESGTSRARADSRAAR
jgi:glyoxylase I family protein